MAANTLLDRTEDAAWAELSALIAGSIGLHFPRERLRELQRGLGAAACEWGFGDVEACRDWLLSAPLTRAQLRVLASHLTIGETYFFRDRKTLDVLARHVLPELIHARRGRDQRLRLWSAGCCTGEEAYSLAILLHQVLPDLADWHVTILATDINPRFLRKAEAGSYGEWSFRDVPEDFKTRYFDRADARYVIRPELQRLVTFESLNLADDSYVSPTTVRGTMDVILCRNVLMYFTPAQVRKVIGNLHQVLIDGGWLAVSPSESSHELFPQFVAPRFPGVILYQKSAAGTGASQISTPAPLLTAGPPVAPPPEAPLSWIAPAPPPAPAPAAAAEHRPTALAAAISLFKAGSYAQAADTLLASCAAQPRGPEAFSLLARALANQGRLGEALAWCDRWTAADKLDAAAHFVRAAVLLEHAQPDAARGSLQRALYLDPHFVLAHFALGTLAQSQNRTEDASRHFANTLRALGRLQPHDRLPESDGLTAERLTETIMALAGRPHAASR